MPITFRVDHEGREIYVVAEGSITLTDIRQHPEEERHAGALAYRELIDGSKAVVAFSTQDVRAIVALLREFGCQGELGPTAVVVADDFALGMLRMLQMLVDDVCVIRSFRSLAEAQVWLQTYESLAGDGLKTVMKLQVVTDHAGPGHQKRNCRPRPLLERTGRHRTENRPA